MKRHARTTASALVLLAVMASLAPAGAADPACVHPYPCGDEWPAGLSGPFALKQVTEVFIPSHDGAQLHGWIGLPDVPAGVQVPVAVHSTPYMGFCHETAAGCIGSPAEDAWWSDPPGNTGVPPVFPDGYGPWLIAPIEFIKRGIATTFFDVRGTGGSGGCFEYFGRNEQRDQRVLVDWLGTRDWSNGRVAMGGASYPGTTPWEAAIEPSSLSSDPLKTIVTAGILSDLYTHTATPQGAMLPLITLFPTRAEYMFDPHVQGTNVRAGWLGPAGRIPVGRGFLACPDVVDVLTTHPTSQLGDERNAGFWNERRLADRFENVTAAVLLTQAFNDTTVQPWQEDAVWTSTPHAPKWLLEGFWEHTFPGEFPGILPAPVTFDPSWEHTVWSDIVLSWLEFWLWGKRTVPEHLNHVTYQDDSGAWHRTPEWPPAGTRREVAYLTPSGLTASPTSYRASFRAVPDAQHAATRALISAGIVGDGFTALFGESNESPLPEAYPELCERPTENTERPTRTGLGFLSEALDQDTHVAGDPFAYLNLRSDGPGGTIAVHLLDVDPEFTCASPDWNLVSQLSAGAADLRFYQGNFTAMDFPINEATQVRVDLSTLATLLKKDHRIGLTVGVPPPSRWAGQPRFPTLTLGADGEAASPHIVLPFITGTLGGSDPTLTYPPRPFMPV